MTYSPLIPQGDLSPASQVVQVQTNFSTYQTGFNSNHVNLNTSGQGKHATIVLERQTSDPGVTEDLAVLYNKNAISNLGTQPQLFLQIPKFLPNEVPNTPMQLTYNSVNTAGPIYQSFLSGGYLLYFGTITDITIPITLSPAPTKILMANATPNTMTTAGTPIPFTVSTQILTTSSFKINSTLNAGGPVIAYSFTWIAVGKV